MAGIHSEAYLSSGSNQSDSLIENPLYGNDIVSINDLSLDEINLILSTAEKMKTKTSSTLLNGRIVANCFFEPSTRTRLSFETAVLRLGGQTIGFSGDEATSIKKGETLSDTIRVIASYADLIVIRHPNEGAARLAAEVSNKPVINVGDGANQHPTQAMVDLFTIKECQGKLDGLSIALIGDLKYGRTIHSFVQACMRFDIRLFLVSPNLLTLPEPIFDTLKQAGVRFSFHNSIEEVIPKVDILYMTRIQQERFSQSEYQSIKKHYILTPDMLPNAKSNLKVMHPLPRINEINTGIDKLAQAHYFEQAANGVCVRQALLALLLNKVIS